jgi:UDP-N-acetylmuramoyl-L-alanyl-D-glutamate--2,6-diaminopimelate ligase
MILADLIDGLDILYTRGNADIEIDGIAYDSRKVRKGYVFVSIAADGRRA